MAKEKYTPKNKAAADDITQTALADMETAPAAPAEIAAPAPAPLPAPVAAVKFVKAWQGYVHGGQLYSKKAGQIETDANLITELVRCGALVEAVK